MKILIYILIVLILAVVVALIGYPLMDYITLVDKGIFWLAFWAVVIIHAKLFISKIGEE